MSDFDLVAWLRAEEDAWRIVAVRSTGKPMHEALQNVWKFKNAADELERLRAERDEALNQCVGLRAENAFLLKTIQGATGIERSDDPCDEVIWCLPAEPGPVQCDSLHDALVAFGQLVDEDKETRLKEADALVRRYEKLVAPPMSSLLQLPLDAWNEHQKRCVQLVHDARAYVAKYEEGA